MSKTSPPVDPLADAALAFEPRPFRMLHWAVLSVALMVLALLLQQHYPGNVIAVTLYKAHLLALGGWGGYWLDRALFPYDRPHRYFQDAEIEDGAECSLALPPGSTQGITVSTRAESMCMLRRAIIVAACLITVGLGA